MKNFIKRIFSFSLVGLLKKYNVPNSGCLHVGANIGSELECYESFGFKQVVWIEGYTPFFDILIKNINNKPNHHALNYMISDQNGETVEFRVASNTGSSTMLKPTDSWFESFGNVKFEKNVKVNCRRLDDLLLKKFDIEYLKDIKFAVFDIEGAELKALKSLGKLINNFDFILTEINIKNNFENGPLLYDIDKFMHRNSFKRVYNKYSVSSGDALYKRVNNLSFISILLNKISSFFIQTLASIKITNLIVKFKSTIKKYI